MSALFKKMPEYNDASKIQLAEIERSGYSFLNSRDNDKIHQDKDTMVIQHIHQMGNPLLRKMYEDWMNFHSDRENHWIQGIQTYYADVATCNSILMVGSGHRFRLIEKVRNLSGTDLIWEFHPFK